MTYSFPCTDISSAGQMKGFKKGDNTRSALLWEVGRLLNECEEKPQLLLMENVPQIHSKNNMEHFQMWIDLLESFGYKSYYYDMNAKDYGIPQNRNRTFMVSILGDYSYEFPKPMELKIKLKDLLEDSVDEKYYLSQKMLDCFMSEGTGKYPRKERFLANMTRDNKDIANAITTLAGGGACYGQFRDGLRH